MRNSSAERKNVLQDHRKQWILSGILSQQCNFFLFITFMCGYQCDKAVTKNDTREVI